MVTFRRTNSCFFYRIKLVCVIYLQNLVCCPEKASSLHSPPDNCKFKPAQNTLQREINQVFCYRIWQESRRFIIRTVVKGLFIKNNFENTTSCSKAEMKICWKKHVSKQIQPAGPLNWCIWRCIWFLQWSQLRCPRIQPICTSFHVINNFDDNVIG